MIASFIKKIAIIFSVIVELKACLSTRTWTPDGIWAEKSYTREIVESCHCGEFSNRQYYEKPWNVYVFTALNPEDSYAASLCIGTIIASNLVATSHKCLTTVGRRLNIYDVWRPSSADFNLIDFTRAGLIYVNTTQNRHPLTESFEVENIVLNPKFTVTSAADTFPVNDLALIVVKADFTKHSDLRPICIAEADEKVDLAGVQASYYGWSWTESQLLELRRSVGGLAFGEECERWQDPLEVKQLCQRYTENQLCVMPEEAGSPLILAAKDGRAFLLGLMSKKKIEGKQRVDYFSNVLEMTKYIEYVATSQRSRWCRKSKFEVSKEVVASDETNLCGPWPEWNKVEPPIKRDESLDCDCGLRNTMSSLGRVVGGESAKAREFGWMALLEFYFEGYGMQPACGGTVINNRVIMTAAHCVVEDSYLVVRPPTEVNVVLNAHAKFNDAKARRYKVEKVIPHPGYSGSKRSNNTFDFDIALLILEVDLTFPTSGDGVRPICVPKLDEKVDISAGRMVTVAGWGLTDAKWVQDQSQGKPAIELQKLDMPMLDMKVCKEFDPLGPQMTICAGTMNLSRDAAPGDSGGPLFLQTSPGKSTQIGIVSNGFPFGPDPINPTQVITYYADVQLFIRFIDYHSDKAEAKWCER